MKRYVILVMILLVLALAGCSGGESITVEFVSNCENAYCMPENSTVLPGEKLDCPAFPVREGYLFDGWFTDPELQRPFDFSKKITKPLKLYAGWIDENSPEAILSETEVESYHREIENILQCASNIEVPAGADHAARQTQAADAVAGYAQKLREQGIVTHYSRQGNSVYIEFASQLAYLYIASEEGTSASGEHVDVLCVEPFAYEWRNKGWAEITKKCAASLHTLWASQKDTMKLHYYGTVESRSELIDLQCLPESEVLLWDGHGGFTGEESVLLTAIEFGGVDVSKPGSLLDAMDYQAVRRKELVLCTVEVEEEVYKQYVALRPQFIRKYFLLDDALVYLSTCSSLQNDTMAQAFIDQGASVVFGNAGDEAVYTWYTQLMMQKIISLMSGEEDGIPYTASEALEKVRNWMPEDWVSAGIPYNNKSFMIGEDGTFVESNSFVDYVGSGEYTISAGVDVTLKMAQSVDAEMLEVSLILTDSGNNQIKHREVTLYRDEPCPVRIWGIDPGSYTLTILQEDVVQYQLENLVVRDHRYLDAGEFEVEEAPLPLVSDAYHAHAPSYQHDGGVHYYIPRVNLPGGLAEAVNDIIYRDLIGYVRKEASYDRGMSYLWGQKDDIVSILVLTGEDYNTAMSQFFVYNVSAGSGDRLENSTLWEAYGLTEKEYQSRLVSIVNEYYDGLNTSSLPDSYQDHVRGQMERSLSGENLKAAMPYVDGNGDLCVMIKLYSLAGPDYHFFLYNLTGGATPARPEHGLHDVSACLKSDDSQMPYQQFLEKGCYSAYLDVGETAEGYAILDINGDGVEELIIDTGCKTQEFHNHLIYTVNEKNQISHVDTIYSYHCVRHSADLGALGYIYPRDAMVTLYHCSTIENGRMYESHTLYYDRYENICTIEQYDSSGNQVAILEDAQEEYEGLLATFGGISWKDVP